MKEQKFMFQFINHKNGYRSEPLIASYEKLGKTLRDSEDVANEDYILLVALIDPDDDQGMVIPKTPLLQVGTFRESFNRQPEETAEIN